MIFFDSKKLKYYIIIYTHIQHKQARAENVQIQSSQYNAMKSYKFNKKSKKKIFQEKIVQNYVNDQ